LKESYKIVQSVGSTDSYAITREIKGYSSLPLTDRIISTIMKNVHLMCGLHIKNPIQLKYLHHQAIAAIDVLFSRSIEWPGEDY
jgi:hypothetical protein